MTDRCNGLLVVLDREMRVDNARTLCHAIAQMRNVVKAEPITDRNGLSELVLRKQLTHDIGMRVTDLGVSIMKGIK